MIAFDLISDLHTETWPDFDWSELATSPVCVVAGDVCRDHTNLENVLKHLGQCYQQVLYIDGNEEHKHHWATLGENFQTIDSIIARCDNVVYLHDNLVILNRTAFLGTNGWWTWDFDPGIEREQTMSWFSEVYHTTSAVARAIDVLAVNDTVYLAASVTKLQTMPDVDSVVIVTHTVPGSRFVEHDIDIINSYRINVMGNSMIRDVLAWDTERKIKCWCFGHYHGSVDQIIDGVRFVNNCRGRGDTAWKQTVYYPKMIR